MYCKGCIYLDGTGIPMCKLYVRANLRVVTGCENKEEADEQGDTGRETDA